ncbi:MAG TPA: hypothetical protein DEP60_10450, partial [Ruminococcaceae bacterium]|nr:hypothetical protein [Oscillospiraceae bacterium]
MNVVSQLHSTRSPHCGLLLLSCYSGALHFTISGRATPSLQFENLSLTQFTHSYILPKLHVALEILFKNIFAYLIKERGVDGDLVRRLVRENKIYLSRSHNNLVMVDYDSEGKARFATNK